MRCRLIALALAVVLVVLALLAMPTLAQTYTFVIEGSSGTIEVPPELIGKLASVKVIAVPPSQPDLGNLEPLFVPPLRGGVRIGDYGLSLSLVNGNLTGVATINITSDTLTVSAWATYDCIGPGLCFFVTKSVPVDKIIVEINPSLTFVQTSYEIGYVLPDVLGSAYMFFGLGPQTSSAVVNDQYIAGVVVNVITGETYKVWVSTSVGGSPSVYARLRNSDWLLFGNDVWYNGSFVPLTWSAVLPFDRGILLALTSYNGTTTYKLWLCTPSNPLGEEVMGLPSQAHALCSIDGRLLAVGLQDKTLIIDSSRWITVAEIPGYCICAATRIASGKIFAVAFKDVSGTPYVCFIEVDPSTWSVTELETTSTSLASWDNVGVAGLTIRRHGKALLWAYNIKDYEASMFVLVDISTGSYSTLIQYRDIYIGTADIRWEAVPRIIDNKVYLPTSSYAGSYYAVTIDLSTGTVEATNNTIALTSGGTWIQYVGGHTVCFRNVYVISGWIAYFDHSEIWLAEPRRPHGAVAYTEPGCTLLAVTTDKGPLSPNYISLASYITGAIVEEADGTLRYIKLPSPVEIFGKYQVLAIPLDTDVYMITFNATYACIKSYSRRKLVIEVDAPSGTISRIVAWLPALPKRVLADGRVLKYDPSLSEPDTWRYDPASNLLECIVMHHSPVIVEIEMEEEVAAAAAEVSVYRASLVGNVITISLMSSAQTEVTVYINGRKYDYAIGSGLQVIRISTAGMKPPYHVSVVHDNTVIWYGTLTPEKPVVVAAIQPAVQPQPLQPVNAALLIVAIAGLVVAYAFLKRRYL